MQFFDCSCNKRQRRQRAKCNSSSNLINMERERKNILIFRMNHTREWSNLLSNPMLMLLGSTSFYK
jgi:hypothetical protein